MIPGLISVPFIGLVVLHLICTKINQKNLYIAIGVFICVIVTAAYLLPVYVCGENEKPMGVFTVIVLVLGIGNAIYGHEIGFIEVGKDANDVGLEKMNVDISEMKLKMDSIDENTDLQEIMVTLKQRVFQLEAENKQLRTEIDMEIEKLKEILDQER